MLLTVPANLKLITFDCYGTLIDWDEGLQRSLGPFAEDSRQPLAELVEAYIRTEATLEQGAYRPYREIQRITLAQLAERFRFTVPSPKENALSDGIAKWAPFDDTIASLARLKTRYMLGVLSNIDIDLFAASASKLQIPFDLIITAEDVEAYKPSHAHFLRMLQQTGLKRENILHVAQSLYHDAKPAAELGLPFVWINRYGQDRPHDVPMLAEFQSLEDFANTLLGEEPS
ncbi:MAG: haloacid dehalogenase type II [Planctomycetes bacterium]|nr:haloacid dehalogenase type II [Planctomycetota bacterium]